MKALIPLVYLVGSLTIWAEPKANLEEAVSEFRGSFARNHNSQSEKQPSTEPTSENDNRDVIKLESFTVTESVLRHDLENAIRDHAAEQERTETERSFSWKRGGLIASQKIGKMTADLGLWPKVGASFQAGASGAKTIPTLRVDVLHVRW